LVRVTVEGRFDYETALPFGRFIEEEIGADWYENPLADDDLVSYARLSTRIDTPLATGARYIDAANSCASWRAARGRFFGRT